MEVVVEFFQSVEIFRSLNIDHTVIYQFFIFFILFLILKPLFLNKLQSVIELRESKTIGLSNEADSLTVKASELVDKYNKEVNIAYSKSSQFLSTGKTNAIMKEKTILKDVENKLEDHLNKQIAEASEEALKRSNELKGSVDEMVKSLIDKLKS